MKAILEKAASLNLHLEKSSGGSVANAIHGLAKLGSPTGYIGKIGNDDYGSFFRSYMEENNIPIQHLNFLNFDIQGVELRALKSMEKYLSNVDYIYTEINTDYVYKDCNLVGEIDEYLKKFGFTRVATKIASNFGWGDAFYIKQ